MEDNEDAEFISKQMAPDAATQDLMPDMSHFIKIGYRICENISIIISPTSYLP